MAIEYKDSKVFLNIPRVSKLRKPMRGSGYRKLYLKSDGITPWPWRGQYKVDRDIAV